MNAYKLCAVLCLVTQSSSTLYDPMDCSLPGSSLHGDSPGRILEWVAMLSSRGSSQSRDRTQVSCTAADSFPSEPPGKPMNTGVGSLSLLQEIFPTQELNRGLLHGRRILYQLNYQGSTYIYIHSRIKKQRHHCANKSLYSQG